MWTVNGARDSTHNRVKYSHFHFTKVHVADGNRYTIFRIEQGLLFRSCKDLNYEVALASSFRISHSVSHAVD